MKPKSIFLLSLLTATAAAYSQTAKTDTSHIKSAPVAQASGPRTDTAVVSHFNGVPVFYHCTPLHKYTSLGIMGRTTLVNYSSQAFERYAKVARRHHKGRIGIVIDNLNFGTDTFQIVQFAPTDTNIDTAVFSTPIFLSAKPTKHYKVVRVLNDEIAYGGLNKNLDRYLKEAGDLHVPYDGIMLHDINYGFRRDQIFVFKWKK